jgi:GTP-binding protein YchF
MPLSIGIVGLPNVGKSTLFNALTRQSVVAENYPFATIDPNVGVVAVPDDRLEKLAALERSKKITPTIIEFVDIAGLVKNAHKGEGRGNKFLSAIREVDAIAEVVRFFNDPSVHHVEGGPNPERDRETIEIELILADLETVKKRLDTMKSQAKSGDKKIIARVKILEQIEHDLSSGKLANQLALAEEERPILNELQLLTAKPLLYVANCTFDAATRTYMPPIPADWNAIPIDAKLEEELNALSEPEKKAYLKELGLELSGLDRLIQTAYQKLGLITFFTTGPDETRAWTVKTGSTAPIAAGKIHTDFQRGFIKAETINWQKLLQASSWAKAKELGLVRTEGKEYIVHDGDVMIFKFNV